MPAPWLTSTTDRGRDAGTQYWSARKMKDARCPAAGGAAPFPSIKRAERMSARAWCVPWANNNTLSILCENFNQGSDVSSRRTGPCDQHGAAQNQISALRRTTRLDSRYAFCVYTFSGLFPAAS